MLVQQQQLSAIVVLSLVVSLVLSQQITTTTKHFCFTSSPLLSEKLGDCNNITAESCKGGVASVRAYQRHMQAVGEPTFVLYVLEHLAPFVLMHPNKMDVNKQFFERFDWPLYATGINVVTSPDTHYSIRDPSLPMVTANVVIDPASQWIDCRTQVYVDPETGIGFTVLNNIDAATTTPEWRPAIIRALEQLERRRPRPKHVVVVDYLSYTYGPGNWSQMVAELQRISPIKIDGYFSADNDNPDEAINQIVNGTHVVTAKTVIFNRGGETASNLVCMDWTVQNTNSSSGTMRYSIQGINRTQHDLHEMPENVKDAEYWSDLNFSREKDLEAVANDPIVGYTTEMVEQTRTGFASCFGGECQIGSIFADAFRWKLNMDVGFANSGGPRGPGWPAGPVRFSDLFTAMPWQDRLCHATIRGLSLWEIYNTSINVPDKISTITSSNGWQLFQVSGMRVYYNNNTSKDVGRLNGIEIWNRETSVWEPLDRLKLYNVVITDFECGFLPWVKEPMTGARYAGEVAATIRTDLTVQKVLADYLTAQSSIESPLDISPTGRFINQARGAAANSPFSASQRMQWTETSSVCAKNTFWDETVASCLPCKSGEVSDGGGTPCKKEDGSSILIVAIVVPIAVLIIFVLVLVLLRLNSQVRDTSNAPKSVSGDSGEIQEISVMFTDIQASTLLWSSYPNEMGPALDMHHQVIRRLIQKYKCYEVKTIGDAFMVVSSDPHRLLELAVSIQEELFQQSWGPAGGCFDSLYKQLEKEEFGNLRHDELQALGIPNGFLDLQGTYSSRWNGLRVRIALHTGEGEVRYDPVAKGFDYYGSVVNIAARIESVASGGQIVMSSPFRDATRPDIHLCKDLGEFSLRGVNTGKMNLVQRTVLNRVHPLSLEHRGSDVEEDEDGPKEEDQKMEVMSVSGSSQSSGAAGGLLKSNSFLQKQFMHRNRKHQDRLVVIHQAFATAFKGLPAQQRSDSMRYLCNRWRLDTLGGAPDSEHGFWSLAERLVRITSQAHTLASQAPHGGTDEGHTDQPSYSDAEASSQGGLGTSFTPIGPHTPAEGDHSPAVVSSNMLILSGRKTKEN